MTDQPDDWLAAERERKGCATVLGTRAGSIFRTAEDQYSETVDKRRRETRNVAARTLTNSPGREMRPDRRAVVSACRQP